MSIHECVGIRTGEDTEELLVIADSLELGVIVDNVVSLALESLVEVGAIGRGLSGDEVLSTTT